MRDYIYMEEAKSSGWKHSVFRSMSRAGWSCFACVGKCMWLPCSTWFGITWGADSFSDLLFLPWYVSQVGSLLEINFHHGLGLFLLNFGMKNRGACTLLTNIESLQGILSSSDLKYWFVYSRGCVSVLTFS